LSRTSASSRSAFAFEHVEHVEAHARFEAEHDVEIAQADVGVDERDARAGAASATPTLAVVVVLPTPPLPLVTTIARPRLAVRGRCGGKRFFAKFVHGSTCLSAERLEPAEEIRAHRAS
jgi:hypothetical protein